MNHSNKLLILFMTFIILSVGALACQYTETVKIGEKEISVLYVDGDKEDNPLEIKNWRTEYDCCPINYYQTFEVHNILEIPVNVTIRFTSAGVTIDRNVEVPAKGFSTIGRYISIDSNSIIFIYNKNNYSEGKWKTVDVEQTICSECPEGSGKNCSDDGDNCSSSASCGGGYCVDSVCTNLFKCSKNEITCADGKTCVVPNSIQLCQKPICSARECISNYLSAKTGECSLRLEESCQKNCECESNNCVEGKCASAGTCPSTAEFCSTTKQCVNKNSIKEGLEPKCNLTAECVEQTFCSKYNLSPCITKQYLNPTTGLCAENPEITNMKKSDEMETARLQKEERTKNMRLILILIIILILLLIAIFIGYRKGLISKINAHRKEAKDEKTKLDKLKKEAVALQKEKEDLKKAIVVQEQTLKEHKAEIKDTEQKMKKLAEAEEKVKEWEKIDIKGEN